MKKIETSHVGRGDITTGIALALASAHHVFIVGPHGTGKSAFAKEIFDQIDGGKKFFQSLTKFDSIERILGGINFEKLEKDSQIFFNIKGSMADCELAVVDEFMDAPDPLLRTMLGILNEREFKNGPQQIKCPLHTCIALSNFMRENEYTAAVNDRFLIRAQVEYVRDTDDRIKMLMNSQGLNGSNISEGGSFATFEELKRLSDKVHSRNGQKMEWDGGIIDMYCDVVERIERELPEDEKISDRRKVWTLDLLKANAVIRGSDKVEVEDVRASRYGLSIIGNPELDAIVNTVIDTAIGEGKGLAESKEKIKNLTDTIEEIKAIFSAGDVGEIARKIADFDVLESKAYKLAENPSTKQAANKIIETLERLKTDASTRLFGN